MSSIFGNEEDNYSDNVPDMTVKALSNPVKMGYLDKKNTGTLLGNIFSWKKRYCVLHKNILYCFKKPEDKKQQCAFFLNGYEFREAPHYHKDPAKKDLCFELVSPGKKSHQVAAVHLFSYFSCVSMPGADKNNCSQSDDNQMGEKKLAGEIIK
uniref:PH domain-containing protein n=1 Tax=Biomphalaria glabrata TaxID=6526 RepID=A0A2C9KS89_BIOGL